MNQESAVKLYNRRAKSIAGNGHGISPAAAPSSGQGLMFLDSSATQLKDVRENEVVVVAPNQSTMPQPA